MISSPLKKLLFASLLAASSLTLAAGTTFFVVGDTGDCEIEGAARVGAAIKAQPGQPDSHLIELGDLAYPVATRERLLTCHEPHFGGFKRRLAVPGNHDWHDAGGAGFFSVFAGDIPRKEQLAGPWHLLMLNSNLRDDAWQQQLAWLEAVLATSRGECLIAAWHHPRWSSGKHGDNRFTADLWNRLLGQASFTLHGHDHHFEALPALDAEGQPDPAGVASFIVGNSGARLYEPGWGPRRSAHAHYGQWGFMRLELDGRSYRWQAINTAGQIIDSGSGQCRAAGSARAAR